MNAQIEKEIKKILKNRKSEAENLASQNLLRARENEQFASLEKQINEIKIKIAKCEIGGENSNNLNEKLKKLEKKQEKVLKNLKVDSLEPNYHCKFCSDTGVYQNKKCKCTNQILSEILKSKCGMSGDLPDFKDSKKLSNEENILISKMQEWCDKFPNVSKKNIFLTGQVGVGKTFLCGCMANELIKKGLFTLYATAFAMNKSFIDYCKLGGEEHLDPYLNSDVLIIDDLGTEPILNNITLNYFYLILNERMLNGKSTIINSNLMPDEIIDRYGERIFSRIMNKKSGLIIEYKGEDKRIKN